MIAAIATATEIHRVVDLAVDVAVAVDVDVAVAYSRAMSGKGSM